MSSLGLESWGMRMYFRIGINQARGFAALGTWPWHLLHTSSLSSPVARAAMLSLSLMPRSLAFLVLLVALPRVFADPALAQFSDCFDDETGNVTQKLNVSAVYAQVIDSGTLGMHLNLTVIGTSPQDIVGFTNTSGRLSERGSIGLLSPLTLHIHSQLPSSHPHRCLL